MAIPFRDAIELEELGAAGYLKIQSHPAGYRGALILINVRGEPLEFTYTRVETPHTFLWRRDDIGRHAARKITASLLSLCPQVPRLMLCLAEEVGSELFCQDIQVSIPVCRIASRMAAVPFSSREVMDVTDTGEPMHLFWFPEKPDEGSAEQELLRKLVSHGLLLEPFERAAVGLREVYKEKISTSPQNGQKA